MAQTLDRNAHILHKHIPFALKRPCKRNPNQSVILVEKIFDRFSYLKCKFNNSKFFSRLYCVPGLFFHRQHNYSISSHEWHTFFLSCVHAFFPAVTIPYSIATRRITCRYNSLFISCIRTNRFYDLCVRLWRAENRNILAERKIVNNRCGSTNITDLTNHDFYICSWFVSATWQWPRHRRRCRSI